MRNNEPHSNVSASMEQRAATQLRRTVLVSAAWVFATGFLGAIAVAVELELNFFDWTGRAGMATGLGVLCAVATIAALPWLAGATDGRAATITAVLCVVLLAGVGFLAFAPEERSGGVLGRTDVSPLWYRGARAALFALPALALGLRAPYLADQAMGGVSRYGIGIFVMGLGLATAALSLRDTGSVLASHRALERAAASGGVSSLGWFFPTNDGRPLCDGLTSTQCASLHRGCEDADARCVLANARAFHDEKSVEADVCAWVGAAWSVVGWLALVLWLRGRGDRRGYRLGIRRSR